MCPDYNYVYIDLSTHYLTGASLSDISECFLKDPHRRIRDALFTFPRQPIENKVIGHQHAWCEIGRVPYTYIPPKDPMDMVFYYVDANQTAWDDFKTKFNVIQEFITPGYTTQIVVRVFRQSQKQSQKQSQDHQASISLLPDFLKDKTVKNLVLSDNVGDNQSKLFGIFNDVAEQHLKEHHSQKKDHRAQVTSSSSSSPDTSSLSSAVSALSIDSSLKLPEGITVDTIRKISIKELASDRFEITIKRKRSYLNNKFSQQMNKEEAERYMTFLQSLSGLPKPVRKETLVFSA